MRNLNTRPPLKQLFWAIQEANKDPNSSLETRRALTLTMAFIYRSVDDSDFENWRQTLSQLSQDEKNIMSAVCDAYLYPEGY
jgi:hypothetical protein